MTRPSFLARRYREAVVTLAAALALAASLAGGADMGLVDGFFYDLSLAAQRLRPGVGGQPVAVIAVDSESLDSDDLAAIPRVFFGPYWARLVEGLIQNGVRTIGFDIIFSYSADRFPVLNAPYDRSFREALAHYHDRVVLARSVRSPVVPPIAAAVYDFEADAGKEEPGAIAYTELAPDGDGVQRCVTASLPAVGGQALPTLASALLARVQGPAMPKCLLLAPAAPLETIPTYRLIDILHCLEQDPTVLRKTLAGKVVLIGSNLPEEDRKRTPDRFMPPPPVPTGVSEKCSLARLGPSDWNSRTTPGVFVHAAAIQQTLTGNIVGPLPAAARGGVAALLSVGGALLGLSLTPWLAAAGVLGLAVGCFMLAIVLLPFGFWFPVMVPAAAAAISMVLAYLVRFLIEERRRRRIQNAFTHYLAPSIVEKLVQDEVELSLGGELREVTVMFADFAGFTAMSGRLSPVELMGLTNAYLALVVEAVEATGGYIVDYIGDAAMAMWGAPLTDPEHAANAATAALHALASVTRAKAAADAEGKPGYSVKMGINTGPAVVGNVGAPGRYSYKPVGEMVNVGARLESVPDDYGCRIVVGPQTAPAIADRFLLCELDWIKVKGKAEAIAVYELIGDKASASTEALAYPLQYRKALERYRAGNFPLAEKYWRHHVSHPCFAGPSPPEIMAERAAALRANPPQNWDGVFVKTTK